MQWICELEDVDPFRLSDAAELLAHARQSGLLSLADSEAVQGRLVDLVDRGRIGATDPLAKIDQPVPAADRVRMMSELRTTTEGRRWAEEPLQAGVATTQALHAVGDARQVAVMHGRDHPARDAIFGFLRKLGLDPLEWEQLVNLTGNPAPYNGEAVAAAFEVAQAVVVVLTPDDVGYLSPVLLGANEIEDDRLPTGQPRLNVVLEAGMALQSHPRQTILVEIGRNRHISDLAGRNLVRLDGTPQRLNTLASRLELAGCAVQRSGDDWLEPSAFAALDALTRQPAPASRSADTLDARTNRTRTVEARRQARHLFVEISTIDRTIELALQNGYWWNVQLEGLPAIQWEAARDVLADEAPDLYDAVVPVYVETDQLNKAANNHAIGGHDDYDDSIRARMEALRGQITQAKGAVRGYAEQAS